MARPPSANSIIANAKKGRRVVETHADIATDMILPNNSGAANNPEITDKFVPYTGAAKDVDLGAKNLTTTGDITVGSGTISHDGTNLVINEPLVFDPTSYVDSILGIKAKGYGTYDARWVKLYVGSDGELRLDTSGETTFGFYSGGTAKCYLGTAGSTTGLGVSTGMYLKVGSSGTHYGAMRATSSTGGFYEIKTYGDMELQLKSNTSRITIVGASGSTSDPQLRFYSGNRGYLTWMEDEKRFDFSDGAVTYAFDFLNSKLTSSTGTFNFDNDNLTTSGTATVGADGIIIGGTTLTEAQLQALLALLE